MGLRTERLTQEQTVISLPRLHELYRKEANHDGYLAASLAMGVKQRKRQGLAKQANHQGLSTEASYHLGWLDCLNEYNGTILDGVSRELDAHPHADVPWPRKLRKGQQCIMNEPGCYCLVSIR